MQEPVIWVWQGHCYGKFREREMFLLYFKRTRACAQVYVHECKCMNEFVCMCMSLLEWQAWAPWHAPCICSLSPVPPPFLPADTSPALVLSPAVLKYISSKGATFSWEGR